MAAKRWNPQGKSRELLLSVQRHLGEYSEFITLKQLFYLLVGEGELNNNEASWRKLKTLALKARKHGRLDPMCFSLNVYPTGTRYFVSPQDYLADAARKYRIPRTYGQPCYFEVWVEREPLNAFVENLIREYDVPVVVTGGYSNYSFIHSAAERIRDSLDREGSPKILYLSDFSSSSYKMFEILSEELGNCLGLSREEMRSILFKGAVQPEHIMKYNLPPCFLNSNEKQTQKFMEEYRDTLPLMGLQGNSCVEVEALNPHDLSDLINNILFGLLDQDVLAEIAREEALNRAEIERRVQE